MKFLISDLWPLITVMDDGIFSDDQNPSFQWAPPDIFSILRNSTLFFKKDQTNCPSIFQYAQFVLHDCRGFTEIKFTAFFKNPLPLQYQNCACFWGLPPWSLALQTSFEYRPYQSICSSSRGHAVYEYCTRSNAYLAGT